MHQVRTPNSRSRKDSQETARTQINCGSLDQVVTAKKVVSGQARIRLRWRQVQRVRPKDKKILRFQLLHWKSKVIANNKTKTTGNTDVRSTSEWDTGSLRSLHNTQEEKPRRKLGFKVIYSKKSSVLKIKFGTTNT